MQKKKVKQSKGDAEKNVTEEFCKTLNRVRRLDDAVGQAGPTLGFSFVHEIEPCNGLHVQRRVCLRLPLPLPSVCSLSLKINSDPTR